MTRYYGDTNKDEFYWDLNGVDWKVPIGQFVAEVAMSPEVRAYYEQYACYQGKAGSSDGCQITPEGATFRVTASDLAPGENTTVALGFRPGAFVGYQPSVWERIVPVWMGAMLLTGVLSFVAMVVAAVRSASRKNRTHELGTVVPEYLPPKEASVTTAAEVLDTPRAVMAA